MSENIVVKSEMRPKSSEGGYEMASFIPYMAVTYSLSIIEKRDDLLTLRRPRNSATVN